MAIISIKTKGISTEREGKTEGATGGEGEETSLCFASLLFLFYGKEERYGGWSEEVGSVSRGRKMRPGEEIRRRILFRE